MKWNLRLAAANRGIWKASELQRLLAERGMVNCSVASAIQLQQVPERALLCRAACRPTNCSRLDHLPQ